MPAEDFEFVSQLGHGSYATVYKVRRIKDNTIYAMKRMELTGLRPKQLVSILNEAQVLSNLDHPRIVKTFEAWMEDTVLVMIMEFCGGQDLKEKVQRYRTRREYMDERIIWVYLIEALEGLQYLHANDVLHRDLKPANCFLTEDWELKIGDFNTSKHVGQGINAVSVVGTPLFMAPEMWEGGVPYTSAADIWSLGCLIYELSALRPPFSASKIPSLKAKIMEGKYKALPPYFTQDLHAVLALMLQVDPNKRPTALALLSAPLLQTRVELIRPQHRLSSRLSSTGSDLNRRSSSGLELVCDPPPTQPLTATTMAQRLPAPRYPEDRRMSHSALQLLPQLDLDMQSLSTRDIPGDSGILTCRLRDDQQALHTFLDQDQGGASPQAKQSSSPRAGGGQGQNQGGGATPTQPRRRSNPPPGDEDKGHAEEKGYHKAASDDDKGRAEGGGGGRTTPRRAAGGGRGVGEEAEAKQRDSVGPRLATAAQDAMEGEANATATGGSRRGVDTQPLSESARGRKKSLPMLNPMLDAIDLPRMH